MEKLGYYHKEVEVDTELQGLLDTMNNLEWIETTGCCFGHEASEFHNFFYIQFYCGMSKVNLLAEILDEISHHFDEKNVLASFTCDFNYWSVVHGSQFTAPENCISFNLGLKDLDNMEIVDEDIKLLAVNLLEEGFKKARP